MGREEQFSGPLRGGKSNLFCFTFNVAFPSAKSACVQFCRRGQNIIPAGSLGLGLRSLRQLWPVRKFQGSRSSNQSFVLRQLQLRRCSKIPTRTPTGIDKFSDTLSRHDESHTILDFSIGKDVGLGFLGKNASSVFNFGVRFAQFASETSFSARARPEVQFKYAQEPSLSRSFQFPYYHTYHTAQATLRVALTA